jgi:hypothetical protein
MDINRELIGHKITECLKGVTGPKDREYFRNFLEELIINNAIPIDLLENVPEKVSIVGKTRFDQLYDAALSLVFPKYRKETLIKLLGIKKIPANLKIWRIMLPNKFNLSHVLIRANSFQEAFALGCDYACRMSLRLYKKIPSDLSMRVQFVSEKAVRRMLDLRWANRVNKRKQLQLVGREYTPKELVGARLAAIGHPIHPEYSIAKYAENKDLKLLLSTQEIVRASSVESEIFKK